MLRKASTFFASAIRFPVLRAVVALWLLGGAGVALCAHHTIPPSAPGGVLEVTAPPWIRIDGKVERLSPGARIWGTHRMLVMSASLVGRPWKVRYIRDPQALIHEVWIMGEDSSGIGGAAL